MELRSPRGWKYLPVFALLIVAGCDTGTDGRDMYTLYRSDTEDPAHRVHVATFDAENGQEYNRSNCSRAQQLFQAQPGGTTRFWCERGRFHS